MVTAKIVTQFDLLLKLGVAAVVLILGAIASNLIDNLGELVHFNCRAQLDRVQCELTHEPLIGTLQTLQFDKADLIKITQQSKSNVFGKTSRLVLVTRSHGEIPLTRNWSRSANDQLIAQRDQIDRFLNTQAQTLSVRTHRPWQLWAILVGLGIVGYGSIALLWKR